MPNRKPNGAGSSGTILLNFGDNETDQRAYAQALRMSQPHGRRKRLFIAFLLAVEEWERDHGRDITVDEIASMVMFQPARVGVTLPEAPQIDTAGIQIGEAAAIDIEQIAENAIDFFDPFA